MDNWLQRFLEKYHCPFGEPAFRDDLVAAYSAQFGVDYPEHDDDHFRESLISALGELQRPSSNGDNGKSLRFEALVHWTFSLLAVKAGRRELVRELRNKLRVGYSSAELQKLSVHWKNREIAAARAHFEQDPLRIAEYRRVKNAQKELRTAEHALRKREIDWRFYEVEPIWGRDMSVSRFIEKLKRESKTLSWENFVAGLDALDPSGPVQLKQLLSKFSVKPSIYWYPGSGMDFKPLILDAPNNPTGRRLFRVSEPDTFDDPIIFWMNDHSSYLVGEPIRKDIKAQFATPAGRYGSEIGDHQYDKWDRYSAELSVAEQREDYLFNGSVPVTLFTVKIRNEGQSNKNRPFGGDTYLVIYSNTASHHLFEEVIFPLRLNVVCTVLAAQGGFSSQLRGFEQYRDIPKLLRKCEEELGPVDLYLLDDQAHDGNLKRPNSPYIRHYEYIGGPVRIGWYPCRAFGRPGLKYNRESKLR